MSEADKLQAKAEHDKFNKNGKVFLLISWIFALLGLLFWFISKFHKEPVWWTIPLSLFITWFLLQFVMFV